MISIPIRLAEAQAPRSTSYPTAPHFGPAVAALAIEIDPRHLIEEKAEALAAAGVNRASLGAQDVNPHVQEAINRIQSFEMTAGAAAMLRRAGIAALNFDLMYGLPQQSLADVERSAEAAASLRPQRISVFGCRGSASPPSARCRRATPRTTRTRSAMPRRSLPGACRWCAASR